MRVCPLLVVALPLILTSRLPGLELEPIGAGPYAVGSTNLEVTPREGVPMFDFLNGKMTKQATVYLTDILTHPDTVPTLQVQVPDNRATFRVQAGARIPVVLYVLYPTTRDNPRRDYAFPYRETGDNVFPHMQQPGEKPIFAEPGAKYPLIVYSGGYNTHGLWHLQHLKWLATHGYIVVDIFHGDGRGATLAGNTALRPIELKQALDFLLGGSDFAGAIDTTRIGASGASAGGQTILAAMGGTDPSGHIPDAPDPRVKAGFGLVPFTGGSFGTWPFKIDNWVFGEDRAGLRHVRVPFFAVYGETDTNVPRAGVEAAVKAVSGPATAVILDGETHSISDAANSDVYTWELLFFDACLRGDADARQKLEAGTSVRGGVRDHKTTSHPAVAAEPQR